MATTTYLDHTGTLLNTVNQTLLSFGTSLLPGGAKLIAVSLTNTGLSTRTVAVYLVPAGQVAGLQYMIGYVQLPPQPNGTVPLPGGPWFASDGATVQAVQDVGNDVAARVTAFQEA